VLVSRIGSRAPVISSAGVVEPDRIIVTDAATSAALRPAVGHAVACNDVPSVLTCPDSKSPAVVATVISRS
jgi:hypothetical protein